MFVFVLTSQEKKDDVCSPPNFVLFPKEKMETLLLASGMLLAYQYANAHNGSRRHPTQGLELAPLSNETDPADPTTAASTTATDQRGRNPDGSLREEFPVIRENGALRLNEHRFYTPSVHRNEPVPSLPPPPRLPRRTIHNPAEQELIREIKMERPTALSMSALGNTPYRPQWMRADDHLVPRQEREQDFSTETPRMPDGRIDGFYNRYRQGSLQTVDRFGFGQGGLPFEDQERVIPDGLDPIAANRKPTARYNRYALGEDLTQDGPDRGLTTGLAQGQAKGRNLREETWEVMPTRQIQLASASQQSLLSSAGPGAGVRSSGRGASLGALLGRGLDDDRSKQGIEWDSGPTGNKAYVPATALRREMQQDPGEEVDTETLVRGTSQRPPAPPKGPAMDGAGTAWKFSFDLRKVMDLTTGTKTIKETAPDRKGVVDDDHRRDATVSTVVAANKKKVTDLQPKKQGTGAYSGITVFRGETMGKVPAVSTTAIKATKRQQLETAAPLGANMSGKSVLIKKSDATTKRAAVDDGILKGNDEILDRAGIIAEPRRAPKGTMPDYAQPSVGTMRKPGEFRRR